MDHVIFRDYIVNRRFFFFLSFLFTVVWPVHQTKDRDQFDNMIDGL